jgi:hypothetical protein
LKFMLDRFAHSEDPGGENPERRKRVIIRPQNVSSLGGRHRTRAALALKASHGG